MGYIWHWRVCWAKGLLSSLYGYILPHLKVDTQKKIPSHPWRWSFGRRLCFLSFAFSFSFIAKYHLCDWKWTKPTVMRRNDVMAFPGRQGTWALQQHVACTVVTRAFGDLSRMTQYREQQACPRCSARPAPHGPIHHPRWGQTLFASLHFQKMEKIKAVGVLLNIERTASLCSAAWERDFVGELIAFMSRE